MERWQPQKVIVRELRLLQRRVADAISSTAARAPHRGSTGPLGGSLARKIRASDLLAEKPWGGVLQYSKLGQKLYWFIHGTQTGGRIKRVGQKRSKKRIGGTQRQPARPVTLTLDESALRSALEADAAAHFDRLDARGVS